MDSTEPPQIVYAAPALCRDAKLSEQSLRGGISAARAPTSGWTLTLRVEADGPARLRAVGNITDGAGIDVATREVAEATQECSGLTRAIGVWAGLVLDAEVQRASANTSEPVPSIAAAAADGGAVSGWPPPAQQEPATPEHDWYLHHDESRSLELGAGLFLMTGPGGGALAGPTIFSVIESGHGIFLRPALAYGQTLTSLPPSDVKSATLYAARFDGCIRLPGLYSTHHGMQLDLCAGAEGGMTELVSNNTSDLPYLSVGPSFDLRGELGGKLAAVLRAVAGIDILRGDYVDLSGNTNQPPLVILRLELAFSWDLQ